MVQVPLEMDIAMTIIILKHANLMVVIDTYVSTHMGINPGPYERSLLEKETK